jgi:hypothetical protein
MAKKDDEGIIILEDNMAIACFDIKYCPVCGEKLSERGCNNEHSNHGNVLQEL